MDTSRYYYLIKSLKSCVSSETLKWCLHILNEHCFNGCCTISSKRNGKIIFKISSSCIFEKKKELIMYVNWNTHKLDTRKSLRWFINLLTSLLIYWNTYYFLPTYHNEINKHKILGRPHGQSKFSRNILHDPSRWSPSIERSRGKLTSTRRRSSTESTSKATSRFMKIRQRRRVQWISLVARGNLSYGFRMN